jgi:glycosidase
MNDTIVLHDALAFLYGQEQASSLTQRLLAILEQFSQDHPEITKGSERERVSERDAILISYGDMVQEPGDSHLKTLGNFLKQYLADTISCVHLLPFFPYSSDDGFSVIDYLQVNPDIGSWEDIAHIGESFRLMFDAVINHVSAESEWFQRFLLDDPAYENHFILIEPDTDLSMVFRPRSSPLLTPFQSPSGEKLVWTTFSADQIDLNYQNPEVLFEVIKILLYYVAKGAEFLRLDAVTFLWKEINTSSANLPQTHRIIQLIRKVLDSVAPHVSIITETNIPHKDNIAYFGDGTNEAHLVYQFALPPLVLHTLLSGDASHLSAWASNLRLPSDQVTFFNFLASHDGIGLRPTHGILSDEEIAALVQRTETLGGGISYRQVGKSERSPYELNVNYFDALVEPESGNIAVDRWISQFLVSQAIMLSMVGVPGIYFHSLFGSRNDLQGVERTGQLRSINREKLAIDALKAELADPGSLRARVFGGYIKLLQTRRHCPAFHPLGQQQILDLGPDVFALVRRDPSDGRRLLCLHEVAGESNQLSIPMSEPPEVEPQDLLSGTSAALPTCTLAPYQTRWIQLD